MRDPELIPPDTIRGDDLRQWHVVECECRRCHHSRVILHALLQRGGRGSSPLSALRFQCQWCGADGPHKLTVYAVPRNW